MNRPDLFVYVGLVAAWVLVAAWAYRIGGFGSGRRFSVAGRSLTRVCC